ncbi:uncharacterized protein A1O9_11962 [Exophiala aquamarina CBS 119918]|uniref:Uncharacterized protein n=1 Tax=Exophiala aquamarina CBS 119918 TaxID=1182545 RepID=A0A072NX21_9EURO|nr:uncharacterized protein A1O9_11962 [Exophiala aquamarina CBS 119918]KEF51972.1 hypothetical protein A1O9_11962 [Exophiala aquamarina CBS 119918]
MGRFTQLEIRNAPSKDHATAIEDYLYRWTKYLPEQLRLNHKVHTYQSIKPYILESRQLNVLYLTTIFLLYRLKTLEGSFPTAAVIAASTLAGVFEDFLARDEVRDLKTLALAQEEMKKWPSANGNIASTDRMYKLTVATQKKATGLPESTLTPYQAEFFGGCDLTLCRMSTILARKPEASGGEDRGEVHFNTTSQQILPVTGDPSDLIPMPPPQYNQSDGLGQKSLPEPPSDADEPMTFDKIFQEEVGQSNGAIGDWLFWDSLAFDAN